MAHNLTLIADTELKTRMDSNRLARQSLGMLKICKYLILLSSAWEEERREMNKIEIFKFGFSNLLKVNGTFGVDVALGEVDCKLFELLCFVFLGTCPVLSGTM